MATPEAILYATEVLAEIKDLSRVGRRVIVSDVGGATTDFYSALVRRPVRAVGTGSKGLVAPSLLRTVQGDLGIRLNAPSVLDSDSDWLETELGELGSFRQACEERSRVPFHHFRRRVGAKL